MTHHNLKITDHWWRELYDGRKTCEARLDDRDNHILSVTDGRLADAERSVAHQDEVIDRRDRSISALRGRITKLRKQLDAKGGVS